MNPSKLRSILFVLAIALVLVSCSDDKLRIGLSKGNGEHYQNYSEWLSNAEDDIQYFNFYKMDIGRAVKKLDQCDALVLTGGPDVHPGRYGQPADSVRSSIDRWRDTLEFVLIKKAMKLGLPIMAICRGEQIMNVAMGGSLIVDIPEDYNPETLHRCDDPTTCFHPVEIVNGSNLWKITRSNEGMVNTNHHQAVNVPADELTITARGPDGIVEAIEWKDALGKPFLIAVQWHPERMDTENPLSGKLRERFLREAWIYKEMRCDD
ncbi:MAG: gamma-glutamyl-gamma-aminobutyrate hydrolase family protein [Candidatus Kapaibacterium sp.]